MKPLNCLVVISWHTPWKCVRVLVGTTSIRLSEDNDDSWVMCIASVECKTVITVVLMVMSKFFLNLLLQISKALVNSKIQFLFEKNFSSEFGPPSPASPVLARSTPHATVRVRSAHPGLRGLGVFTKSRLFFEFAQPGDDAFFLCHCHAGPAC
jgi:hypothetical protein